MRSWMGAMAIVGVLVGCGSSAAPMSDGGASGSAECRSFCEWEDACGRLATSSFDACVTVCEGYSAECHAAQAALAACAGTTNCALDDYVAACPTQTNNSNMLCTTP